MHHAAYRPTVARKYTYVMAERKKRTQAYLITPPHSPRCHLKAMDQLTSRVVKRETSIIDDVLTTIKELRAAMDRVELIPLPSGNDRAAKQFCEHTKQEARDTLTDIHEKLCRLMVTMIHTPMNKRMLAPFPALVVSGEEMQESLKSQMGC